MPAIKSKVTKAKAQKTEAKSEVTATQRSKRVTFADDKKTVKTVQSKKSVKVEVKSTKDAAPKKTVKAVEEVTEIVKPVEKAEPKKKAAAPKKKAVAAPAAVAAPVEKAEPKKVEPKKAAAPKKAEPKKKAAAAAPAAAPAAAKEAPKKVAKAAPKKAAKDTLKKVAAKVVEEDKSAGLDSDDSDAEELNEEQEEKLRKDILGDLASDSEGEDSSEDEEMEDDTFGANKSVIALSSEDLEQSKLETKALFDQNNQIKGKASDKTGVIYLGRIPHGFFEKEMKEYFSQFGEVTRLRLSRNKKTGNSKHYAFIEFASEDVAAIVADTMNNYMLFERVLMCHVVPKEKIHENLFVGANKKFKKVPWLKVFAKKHNKPKTPEELAKQVAGLTRQQNKRQKRLEALGIDYALPSYA
ncbi:hypothetical protein J3Q64DRAFT_1714715 [Phycomyces blakesleeanus]|uniref:RRM domain-containing protein n=2 Tax=Phycomyces blakesleeanus TaxID=4837 RepID=A0ABR3BIF6_PHYBL